MARQSPSKGSPLQPPPPVLLLSMAPYGVGCPFGQSGSGVPTVSPPSILCTPSLLAGSAQGHSKEPPPAHRPPLLSADGAPPPAPAWPPSGDWWCHVPWLGRKGSRPCPCHRGNGLCPACRAWAGSGQHAGTEGWGHCHVVHALLTFWSPAGKGKSSCSGRREGARAWAAPLSCPTGLRPAPASFPTGQGCAGACLCPRAGGSGAWRWFCSLSAAPGRWRSCGWARCWGKSGGCCRHSRTGAGSSPAGERCPHACGHSCLTRGKRWLGAHPALSPSLAGAQHPRRTEESPSDPPPVAPTPAEGAEPPPCHECPTWVLWLATSTLWEEVNTSLSW